MRIGKPKDTAVEGHLYSITSEDGARDASIEVWLGSKVDGPFAPLIDSIASRTRITVPLQSDPKKVAVAKRVGFRLGPTQEYIEISEMEREKIALYVAALIVRTPQYLQKLKAFHKGDLPAERDANEAALKNMIWLLDLYKGYLCEADFLLTEACGSHRFLVSDGVVGVSEPWSRGGIAPFDVGIPLTPTLRLDAFPCRDGRSFGGYIPVSSAGNKLVSLMNRQALALARRFVVSRDYPPLDFIQKYWGKPAPAAFGHRLENGVMQLSVDWQKLEGY